MQRVLTVVSTLLLLFFFAKTTSNEHYKYVQPKKIETTKIVGDGVIQVSLAPKKKKQLSRGLNINRNDLYWLARVISAEAKGEPEDGQIAVGNVILNRAKKDNLTVKQVIFADGQFDSVRNGSIYDTPSPSIMMVARRVLEGERVIDKNVHYFYNPKWTPSNSWIRTRSVVAEIGNHCFAK